MTGQRPEVYDADVDEMTAMGLAVLAELRSRLAAHYPHDADRAAAVTAIVDAYAYELVDELHDDLDDDDPER